MSLPDPTKVAVFGDRGSGKSSLVWRIVQSHGGDILHGDQSELPPNLPRSLGEFVMEMMDIDGHTDVILTDPPPDSGEGAQLLADSSVILLCVPRPTLSSISQIQNTWIPLIQSTRSSRPTPVLVCVTKTDTPLSECDSDDKVWKSSLSAVISACTNSDLWIVVVYTSARTGEGATDAFQKAHDMFVDPIFPIFDFKQQEFTPKGREALSHVFQLCDIDGRQNLSDIDLLRFQKTVFGLDLSSDEILSLKEMISQRCPEGITDDCVNFEGFLHLQRLFLEAGETKNVWQTLRQYGYDTALEFCPRAEWDTDSLALSDIRDRNSFLRVDPTDPSRWSVSSNAGSHMEGSLGSSSFVRVDRDDIASPTPSLEASFHMFDGRVPFLPPSPNRTPNPSQANDYSIDDLSVRDSLTTGATPREESVWSDTSDNLKQESLSQHVRLAIAAGMVAVGVAAYFVLGQRQGDRGGRSSARR